MKKYKGFLFIEIIVSILFILMFIIPIFATIKNMAILNNKAENIKNLSDIILLSNKELEDLHINELPKEIKIFDYNVIYEKGTEDEYFIIIDVNIKDEEKINIQYSFIKRKEELYN